MHFERNQLLPVSLGFSPLFPDHPSEMILSTGNGPPPPFRRASACPGIDRPVSGLVPVIPGAFTPRPTLLSSYGPVAFALAAWRIPISLTTETNSLPRYSKRTPQHCKRAFVPAACAALLQARTFRAVANHTRLDSGSFHPAFAVLFSFLSPY